MYLLVYPGFLSPLPLKFLWNIALRPPMGWTHLSDTTDKRTCLCPFVCLSVCFLDGVWHGTNIHHYKPGFIYNALLGETPPVLSRIQHKTDDDDDDDDALALFIYICCYLLKNAIGYLIVFRKKWGAKASPAGKFSKKTDGKAKNQCGEKLPGFPSPIKTALPFISLNTISGNSTNIIIIIINNYFNCTQHKKNALSTEDKGKVKTP